MEFEQALRLTVKGTAGLIADLERSLREWDDAYAQVLEEWPPTMKLTEDRARVATRNELRQRGVEIPEIVRWKLRAKIGFRSEEE